MNTGFLRDSMLAAGIGYAGALTLGVSSRKALVPALLLSGLSFVVSREVIGLQRENAPLEDWIEQYKEDALDPDEEIIDPHHHLWDPRTQEKGWPISKRSIHMLYM